MHLKQKGYSLGVFLICTITTVTLSSVGWYEPVHSSQQSSHLAPRHERPRALTTTGLTHPPNRGGGKRPQLDSKQGGQSEDLQNFSHSGSRDGTQAETSGGRPEGTLDFEMVSTDRRFTARDRRVSPSPEVCSKGEVKPIVHGKFYVSGQLEANVPYVGYQSDSAASGQGRIRGQWVRGSEEIWQRLQPAVECGDHAMTLTIRRRRAVQLLLDRVNESSVPLSQLTPQCGYSVQTSWRELSLMAQYDACHVTQEDDYYVLPLLWRGTPVKMSCPSSQIQSQDVSPPSVCCAPYVRGEWTLLEVLAEQCGYALESRDAEIFITAPFMTCGITVKNGNYTLTLQTGEKTFILSCPVNPTEGLPLTHQPLDYNPHHTSRGPEEPASLQSFPWAPPFYLAPPNYPHPTYHYKYPSPDRHDVHSPPTTSSPTADPAHGPQPLPPLDSQPHYQNHFHHFPVRETYKHFHVHGAPSSTGDMEDSSEVYSDQQQNQDPSVQGLYEKRSATPSPSLDPSFLIPVEAPPLQPPGHAFSQYYHYYHHPKIPLPEPPQAPDSGPEDPSLDNPQNPDSPVFLPRVQQSEALGRLDSDQFFQPEPTSDTHPASAAYTPYGTQPYGNHYFSYFPYIARGEAKRLVPLNPTASTKMNLYDRQNTKLSTVVHPLPRSLEVLEKSNVHPPIDLPSPGSSPEWLQQPLLPDDNGVKAELAPPGPDTAVPPPKQPSVLTQSPNHNFAPYLYYYYYYYYYYPYYYYHYGPGSLLHTDKLVSPTTSKVALDPLLQASSSPTPHPSDHKPQTTAPPSHSINNIQYGPLHPYYYYHLYHQPKVSLDNQEVHSDISIAKSDSPLPSDSDKRYPSMPQSSFLYSLYPHDITHHPYDAFGHADEEVREKLENEMKDHTLGQQIIFSVSDTVVEPTDLPGSILAHPSEVNNVSCTLQRLTSDPDLYIVPLDGCGVNNHMFGQAVYLLEGHGVHSLQQEHSSLHENSPVREMVGCGASLGSPDVRDQPPPPLLQSTPAMVTVQLRIATDESFSSFHPEPHLPLSLIHGRPVYVEVGMLDPPEPDLVLLVHSCLAYTEAPYPSWMLVYDGCPSQGDSGLLPSPHHDQSRRILISSFLSLPSESPPSMANVEHSHPEDPEIFFLCLTEVCSAAGGVCTVGCINSTISDV